MLDTTVIPEGHAFQLTLTTSEMSLLSLALTVLYTNLKEGKEAGDKALFDGLLLFMQLSSPSGIVNAMNALMLKLDKIADSLKENT
jgi:hypothetical protein